MIPLLLETDMPTRDAAYQIVFAFVIGPQVR